VEVAESSVEATNKLIAEPVTGLPGRAAHDSACILVENGADVGEQSVGNGSVKAVSRGGARSKWGGKAPPPKLPGDGATTAEPDVTTHPPVAHVVAKCAANAPAARNSVPPKSIEQTERPYVVTNEELKATSKGLGYRLTKQTDDKDRGVTAAWGSTVKGTDEGDGWLRVAHEMGTRFLPFTAGVDNVTVLRLAGLRACPQNDIAGSSSASSSAATGTASMQLGVAGQRPKAVSPSGVHSSAASAAASVIQQVPSTSNGVLQADSLPVAKRPRLEQSTSSQSLDMLSVDRPIDLMKIVVNLYHVGHEFAAAVQKKDPRNERTFDWEGVRRGILSLKNEMGLEVIGVIFENWKGPDNFRGNFGVPPDIKAMCAVVMEAPRLTGSNQQRADDEMAIKCAMRRNCLFLTKKGYDWLAQMRDTRCRTWLEMSQNMLQVSYSFLEPFGKFKAQGCALDGTDVHLGTE